jgi:DNA-binding transcriptional ArsR family regulator
MTRNRPYAAEDDRYGRRISDPGALRALAHAGRYTILEHLQANGPATATACAAVAGLSPSACSYHLRVLARHGFVEEDTSVTDGDGRERVWRATATGWWNDVDPDTDLGTVQRLDSTIARVMMASSDEKMLAFADHATAEPDWRDAALFSNSTIVASVGEVAELSRALMALLQPYFLSERPADDIPEDARQVHVSVRMAPRLPPPAQPSG